MRAGQENGEGTLDPETYERLQQESALDFELNWGDDSNMQATLHALEAARVARTIVSGQAAQLAELLEYIHIRLRNLDQHGPARQKTRSRSFSIFAAGRICSMFTPGLPSICGELAIRITARGNALPRSGELLDKSGMAPDTLVRALDIRCTVGCWCAKRNRGQSADSSRSHRSADSCGCSRHF